MPTTTIGVFDSGFGGLTVLRALLPRIPGAHYIYLGDTARLPYGAKSQATIARYAVESAHFLAAQGCDLLVIACNTATALALPEIRSAVRIPVVGVIEPGANAILTAIEACHPEPSAKDLLSTPATNAPSVRAALSPQETCHPEPSAKDLLSTPATNAPSILAALSPQETCHPEPSAKDLLSTPATNAPSILAALSPQKTCHPEPSAKDLLSTPATNAPSVLAVLPPQETCHPEPSAKDLLSTTATNAPSVLVLATAATVQSHAYRDACAALNLHATEKACPLLVPLVEEGWIEDHPGHTVTRDVLRIYIAEALATCTPQAVLLGCTHYPLIASAIRQTLRDLGSTATVIDSAVATAQAVAAAIPLHVSHSSVAQGFSPGSHPAAASGALAPGVSFTCYATDSIEKFQRLGSHFLGQTIPQVHLLDLGG